MSNTISDDSCGGGQVSDWRHQGHDLRPGPTKSRDGACRWWMGYSEPLFRKTRSVPMQKL